MDAREDVLESAPETRIQFRLKRGELEVVEGALTPKEDGLFKVRFFFGVFTANEKISRQTDEILILKGQVDHGS